MSRSTFYVQKPVQPLLPLPRPSSDVEAPPSYQSITRADADFETSAQPFLAEFIISKNFFGELAIASYLVISTLAFPGPPWLTLMLGVAWTAFFVEVTIRVCILCGRCPPFLHAFWLVLAVLCTIVVAIPSLVLMLHTPAPGQQREGLHNVTGSTPYNGSRKWEA